MVPWAGALPLEGGGGKPEDMALRNELADTLLGSVAGKEGDRQGDSQKGV